jgi:hypothetical protein
MKSFRTTLIAAMSFLISISHAATPEEEARFLSALREACLKKDKAALAALSNWDRVPPDIKKLTIDGMAHILNDPIKSVEYGSLDDAPAPTRTINGVTYTANLPVTKQITIQYDLKVGNSTGQLLVGEKNGKLMIVNLAPQQ